VIGLQPAPIVGANQFLDPNSLPDGVWQELKNVAPRTRGNVGSRPSMSFIREVIPSWWRWDARTRLGSAGVASPVAGYWRWAQNLRPLRFLFDPNYGDITMLVVTKNSISVQSETSNLARADITVPAGTVLVLSLPGVITDNGTDPRLRCGVLGPLDRLPSLFVFNGITYAFGAVGTNGIRIEPPGSGTTPVNFSYWSNDFGTGNGDFFPEGAATVRDRVVYWRGSNVYWSDRNDPLSIGPDAIATRGINIGGEELERITAVAEISTSADGSPVQSTAAVFTKTRCFLLLGEPGESDAMTAEEIYGSLQINRLNVEAGCVSPASIVRTPFGTFWAGQDDVWFMPYGSLPRRVGTALRPLLEGQPPALQWKIHAEYFDNKYRLALFAPGQGPDAFAPCRHQWWLDLTNGPPENSEDAHWFGPQEFNPIEVAGPDSNEVGGTWCMARDYREDGDKRLYSLQTAYIQGVNDSLSVRGMNLCTFDTFDGRDTAGPNTQPNPWQASYTYFEGDEITVCSRTTKFMYKFICSVGGGSGPTEPDWESVGPSVTDGSVVWVPEYWSGTQKMPTGYSNIQRTSGEVAWDITSKEFVLGDPLVDKMLDGAEMGYTAAGATKLQYNSHPDQAVGTRLLYPAVVDSTTGLTTGGTQWARRLLPAPMGQRFRALTAVWQCQQVPCLIITAGFNDTITVDLSGEVRTATIPAGVYANVGSLITAVLAALASTFGSPFVSNYADSAALGIREDSGFSVTSVATNTRLAQLLGYDPVQGAFSTASSVFEYAYTFSSPYQKLAPDMQFSGINLRFGIFGRRPL
jgi:hypothetical protein